MSVTRDGLPNLLSKLNYYSFKHDISIVNIKKTRSLKKRVLSPILKFENNRVPDSSNLNELKKI